MHALNADTALIRKNIILSQVGKHAPKRTYSNLAVKASFGGHFDQYQMPACLGLFYGMVEDGLIALEGECWHVQLGRCHEEVLSGALTYALDSCNKPELRFLA